MDFDKIKTAVEEITLSDSQKEDILSACMGKKRKFNYKPLAAVAAVAVIIIALASPGFLLKASSPDSAANEKAEDINEFYQYSADSDSVAEVGSGNFSAQSSYAPKLFEAEGFVEIYSIIPYEFSSLVNIDEYAEWSATVSADGGMAIMQFAEHFGIPREDFERENTACGNLFDAEIIYSFDRELIDSYYAVK